ncbi:ABC transporter ATP-binding protein [Chitinibacter sp. S2-10]|uniref:ABC transporter ATP-binding protein n=1 Tax=Chitinibacter sp. S2-10 TaxID=3373597 RepID=UPI00397732A2
MSLLSLQQLSLSFATNQVVEQVDLQLAAGEKLALVGESGSGKSVLARAILQLDHQVSASGRIIFDGLSLLDASPAQLRAIRGKRIAMIFQEPMSALNPLQTIGRQIAEVLQLHLGYSPQQQVSKAIELLTRTGIAPDSAGAAPMLARYPHQLSGGQRQRVMIAMALAGEPDILIADEPTTALDVTVQAQILQLLADLQRERGMALIMITHDLNLVRRFFNQGSDRVAVMQQGRIVEIAPTEVLFTQPQHEYTKKLLAARPKRIAVAAPIARVECLSARQLSHSYAQRGTFAWRFWQAAGRQKWQTVLAPLDLQLHRAETLAVVGESGSGKTTLALALLRLLQSGRGSGQISLGGQEFDSLRGDTLRRARSKIQIVLQDPFAALSPRMSVAEIVGEGLLVHQRELSRGERESRVVQALLEVGLAPESMHRYPHEFSGGQRQRIAIARALIVQPEILILDEPTSALDATVQQQVLQLLADLQRKHGLSYILISHDMAVVQALAHRVLVLRDGVMQEEADVETLFSAPENAYTRQLLSAAL